MPSVNSPNSWVGCWHSDGRRNNAAKKSPAAVKANTQKVRILAFATESGAPRPACPGKGKRVRLERSSLWMFCSVAHCRRQVSPRASPRGMEAMWGAVEADPTRVRVGPWSCPAGLLRPLLAPKLAGMTPVPGPASLPPTPGTGTILPTGGSPVPGAGCD
jgi:hypothetical protein